MSRNNLKIYIVAHKPFDHFAPDCYVPIRVGSNFNLPFNGDNTGENIASRNDQFCELTAQYWIWKNDCTGSRGLCHYRRYFLRPGLPRRNMKDNVVDEKTVTEILSGSDIILPYRARKTVENMMLYASNRKESNPYLTILREVIGNRCPEYLPAFDRTAYGRRMSYGNMFISGSKIFAEYSEWLFKVLEDYEVLFKERIGELPPRHLGYMAEYLINAWAETNGLRIKYLQTVNVDTGSAFYNKAKMLLSSCGIYQAVYALWYVFYRIVHKF